MNALEQILQRNDPEPLSFFRPGFAGTISECVSILTQHGHLDMSVILPGRSSPVMEDARTSGKSVVRVRGDEAWSDIGVICHTSFG